VRADGPVAIQNKKKEKLKGKKKKEKKI